LLTLETLGRVAAVDRGAQTVTAVLWNEVDTRSTSGERSVYCCSVNSELRRAGRVRHSAASPAAANHRAQRHAVDRLPLILQAAAVRTQCLRARAERTTHVLGVVGGPERTGEGEADARDQDRNGKAVA